MIVHYTKVVVDVLGAENGWDAMVGFPVEIEPLGAALRPVDRQRVPRHRHAATASRCPSPRRGRVLQRRPAGRRFPNEAFATQVIKADAGGTFSYTMPRAGWWGFAALVPGEKTTRPRRQTGRRGAGRPDLGQDRGHGNQVRVCRCTSMRAFSRRLPPDRCVLAGRRGRGGPRHGHRPLPARSRADSQDGRAQRGLLRRLGASRCRLGPRLGPSVARRAHGPGARLVDVSRRADRAGVASGLFPKAESPRSA